eukprot:CAMPEP_0194274428 /NCGR_PEP_ID=MMETSP0169-20130528/7510_1 /TAXON_ID=218684 /ORGANISM="Corethron pennatum, Strain L29A3" /LENGTH=407 /DNA_ID=CAMNT_0039017617 /DNA_START=176 /DNA_END=1396 /DNA_ORIENTATION=+
MHRGTITPRSYLSTAFVLASWYPPLPPLPLRDDGSSSGAPVSEEPLSLHDRFERHLGAAVEAWRALDLRRIRPEDTDCHWEHWRQADPDLPDGSASARTRGYRAGHTHFTLPDDFDVTASRPPPTGHGGPQILNYNGTRGSYEAALDAIFRAVPTIEEIREEMAAAEGNAVAGGRAAAFRRELDKSVTDPKMSTSSTEDASRFRARKAHNFPDFAVDGDGGGDEWDGAGRHAYYSAPAERWERRKRRRSAATISEVCATGRSGPVNSAADVGVEDILIRVEVWKKRLKKGCTPDGGRLEMEFHGGQTLADVHRAVVRCLDISYGAVGGRTDDNAGDHAEALVSGRRLDGDGSPCSSGLFMVEDALYAFGSEDYAGPVLRWLQRREDDAGGSGKDNGTHDHAGAGGGA